MSRRIFRHQVHLGERSSFSLTGDPLHVEAESDRLVSFWTEYEDEMKAVSRHFMIVGTGSVILEGWTYWGTTARTDSGLIWHLYEVPVETE